MPQLWVVADDQYTATPLSDDRTAAQYAAIGTGAEKAAFILSLFGATAAQTVAEALYQACAATFFAEDADGVNRRTRAYILRPGHLDLRPMSLLNTIRRTWREQGQLPMPREIVEQITQQLT
jgi:hypothetical protein